MFLSKFAMSEAPHDLTPMANVIKSHVASLTFENAFTEIIGTRKTTNEKGPFALTHLSAHTENSADAIRSSKVKKPRISVRSTGPAGSPIAVTMRVMAIFVFSARPLQPSSDFFSTANVSMRSLRIRFALGVLVILLWT